MGKKKLRKRKQKWLRMEDNFGWQIVIPDFDNKPHSTDPNPKRKELAYLDCPCKPKINYLDKVIVHNSFIEIEAVDKAMDRLSTQKDNKVA